MCFKTTLSAKAKIAKTDIECFKVIRKDNSPAYRWVHEIRDPYLKDVPAPLVQIKKREEYIYSGYHSAKKPFKEALISEVLDCSSTVSEQDLKVVKFIIPAGTRYYENKTEYVSETIILKNNGRFQH